MPTTKNNRKDGLSEIGISSKEIFKGHILNVFVDTVELPNGAEATREIIRHVGAVCIVPVTENGEVIVEKQFRYPINSIITEIPAGKLDGKSEDRLEAAKRELLEETGIYADEWIDMGLFYPAAAYSDEKITMFLAKGLHFGKPKLDEDEFLSVEKYPLVELVDEVMNGKITDAKTQTAILKAARILGL